MRKFSLLPTTLCIWATIYTPSAIGFSEGAGRGRVYTVTTQDSGSIPHAQTIEIIHVVGSSADILPGTPANVFISNLSTEILLFQNRQSVIPVLRVSYSVEVAEQKNLIKKEHSKTRRTGLRQCFDNFLI